MRQGTMGGSSTSWQVFGIIILSPVYGYREVIVPSKDKQFGKWYDVSPKTAAAACCIGRYCVRLVSKDIREALQPWGGGI
jgi:hypothetical protein